MGKFKRLARWEYVGALRQELKIPVAGNGDIACAEELVKRAAGPCDAVMVGRAAVRQPWIFAQARALTPKLSSVPEGSTLSLNASSVPEGMVMFSGASSRALTPELSSDPEETALPPNASSVPNLEETGLRFLELLVLYQPPEFHVSRAMRFFGFFCDNLKFGNYLKNRLNREKTLSGIEQVWRGYFKENEK